MNPHELHQDDGKKNRTGVCRGTESQELEEVSRPVIKWLNETCHPHKMVVITSTRAELFEGVCNTRQIMDYVGD